MSSDLHWRKSRLDTGERGSNATSLFCLQTRWNGDETAIEGKDSGMQRVHAQGCQTLHLGAWPDALGSRMIWQRGSPT